MAVDHDQATKGGPFTGASPHTVNHTPAGTPRGVLVFITAAGTAAGNDVISGVTYGGTAMTRVATNGLAIDPTGEQGSAYAYFLGASIPTGAQDVVVSTNGGSADKTVGVITLTAAADTEIAVSGKLEGDQANPQIALDTGADTALRYCAIYSGLATPTAPTLTRLAFQSAIDSHDYGSNCASWDRQINPSSGSFTVGYTALSDDTAMIGVAIKEVAGGGEAFSGSAQVTAAATVAAQGAKGAQGGASASDTGSTSATGEKGAQGSASVSASGQVSAQGSKGAAGSVGVTSSSQVSATGQKGGAGSASTTAAGSTAAVGTKHAAGTASVSAAVQVTATGTADGAQPSGSAQVSAAVSVAASGQKGASGAAAVSSAAAITTAGDKHSGGASTVTAGGADLASGAKNAVGTAAITAAVVVSATTEIPLTKGTLVVSADEAGGLAIADRRGALGIDVSTPTTIEVTDG